MYAILVVTFTINIPPMLAYIPYDWILWVRALVSFEQELLSFDRFPWIVYEILKITLDGHCPRFSSQAFQSLKHGAIIFSSPRHGMAKGASRAGHGCGCLMMGQILQHLTHRIRMYGILVVTFTINIPPKCRQIFHTWILWVRWLTPYKEWDKPSISWWFGFRNHPQ